MTSFMHLHSVVRALVLHTTFPVAMECLLSGNVTCTLFNYHLASEMGLSEASWDMAVLLRKDWNHAASEHVSDTDSWLYDLYRTGHRCHHRQADVNLGELAMNVGRYSKNDLEALRFYQLAADRGIGEGIYNLGYAKLWGLGCDANRTAAKELFAKLVSEERTMVENVVGLIMSALMWFV